MSRRPDTRRSMALPAVVVILALAMSVVTTSAPGASAVVTVTASIPSQVALTNNCTDPAGYQLGTVLPGSVMLTSTSPATACRLDFQSNNDSAMLRISQADASGLAMVSPVFTWNAQINSNHTDAHGVSIVPGTPASAFAIGRGGNVYRTTTSGAAWVRSATIPTSTYDLYGVKAVSASRVLVAGSGRQVWLSTDANAAFTFTSICNGNCTTSPNAQYNAITQDATTIYLAGNGGEILTSTDSGTTWALPASPTASGINDLFNVPGTNDVYGCDNAGNVIKTIDGGVTWSRINAGSFGSTMRAVTVVRVATTDYIYATTNRGTVVRGVMTDTDVSSTGGVWTELTVGPHMTSRWNSAITALDKDTVWVGGERGVVMKTANATAGSPTWTEVTTLGAGATVTDIEVQGATLYASHVGAFLSASSNSGGAWTTLVSPSATGKPSYNDIAADGDRAYMAAGFIPAANNLVYTTNGGTNWTTVSSGANATNLYGVALAESSGGTYTGVAVGAGGVVTRTTDAFAGSPSWSVQASGTTMDLNGVALAPHALSGWAVGEQSTILHTTDGGVTWSPQTSPVASTNLHRVAAVNEALAYAVGDGGVILRTTDGGSTWLQVTSGTTATLWDLTVPETGQLLVAGNSNKVLLSTNADTANVASVTFTSVAPAVAGYFRTVAAPTAANIFLSRDDGGIRYSLDGGTSYTSVAQTGRRLLGSSGTGQHSVWIVGEGGRVYRNSGGSTVPDYGAGNQWGTGGAPGLFGVCVQAATGTADWAVDTGGTAGLCEAADADAWHAIPTSLTKVVHTTAAGASGSMTFVWGMRPAASQAPGSYSATVLFEALSPNV